MRPYNPIIVALDYSNLSEAEAMLSKVRPYIGMIKIGLELYTAHGKDSLLLAKDYGIPVFVDLKLHDVPTTIAKTTDVICGNLASTPGQHFLSLHCFGGREMLKTAMNITQNTNVTPIGITLLSSFSESDVGSLGFRNSQLGTRASALIHLGMGCIDPGDPGHPGYPGYYGNPPTPPRPARSPIGMDTFVCAPAQLPLMRKHYKDTIKLITPGIRMDNMESNDHNSAKPPSFALRNGANWIVIGRPITQNPDPAAMAEFFKKQADKY